MLQEDQWPFTPVCLSDTIDAETLSVLLVGCSERLSRPLVLLDYDPVTARFGRRIEPIHARKRFEPFCEFLRNDERVRGGEQLCRSCNIEEAGRSVEEFRRTGQRFRTFPCVMGVFEATRIVTVCGHLVAVLYCGQYLPPVGSGVIRERLQRFGKGPDRAIELDEGARETLSKLADQLPAAPDGISKMLEEEVRYIERIAEAAYHQQKYRKEQEFLDSLRTPGESAGAIDLKPLRGLTRSLLERVRSFCGCEYAVFFGSVQEGATVLAPIAAAGTPPAIEEKLPHFNWRRGGLPTKDLDLQNWALVETTRAALKAIRGDNSDYFVHLSCTLPRILNNGYRGVLVLGPWKEPLSIEDEQRFLSDLVGVISYVVLTQLEVRYLTQERQRWEKTVKLLIHQLRTVLTPGTTLVGHAKLMVKKLPPDKLTANVIELLNRAEELNLRLSGSAIKTMKGHVLHLEQEDFQFERYPLSVLISNCVEGFVYAAEDKVLHLVSGKDIELLPDNDRKTIRLVLDKSIDSLPEADVDIARLTIAFSNLIDNAVKYSFAGTTITVRSKALSWTPAGVPIAMVEVENVGPQIRAEETERIFEEGTRGLAIARMGHITGSGLGLWETRNVLEAHRGTIGVRCDLAPAHGSQRGAYRVVFTVSIPIPL